MNELIQPGHHPDADQLNAFAEGALPAHERDHTLAHLAGCLPCRTIVSLALPPVEEGPVPLPVPARKPWFASWNLAWPIAAALATIVLVTLYVRNIEPTANVAQTSLARADANPPAALTSASPPLQEPSRTSKAVPSPSPTRPIPPASLAGSPPTGPAATALPAARNPVTIGDSQSTPNLRANDTNMAAGSSSRAASGSAGISAAARIIQPPPPALAAPSPAPIQDRSQPPASLSTLTAGAASPAAETIETASAPVAVDTTTATALLTRKGFHELPSHLSVASSASRGKRTLALDAAGTLFISTNEGRRWTSVPAPWPGRALRVDLTSLPLPPPSGAVQDFARALPAAEVADAISAPSAPKSSSTLTGSVTDQTGAIISGTVVSVSAAGSSLTRTTTTGRDGRYVVDGLVPGVYEVEARAPGFLTQRSSVTLAASQAQRLNLTLSIGAANATVTVAADSTNSVSAGKSMRQAAKLAPAKTPSPAPLPTVFAITTATGERWTSSDGQGWKPELSPKK